MADTYRLIAGILIFVLFISVMLAWVATSFSDLAPGGVSPTQSIPQVTQQLPKPSTCGASDWPCGLAAFFVGIGNGLVTAALWGVAIFSMFIALLTFQIPALQANAFTQLLNVMLVVPIVTILVWLGFRTAKSIIPTVGGDAD